MNTCYVRINHLRERNFDYRKTYPFHFCFRFPFNLFTCVSTKIPGQYFNKKKIVVCVHDASMQIEWKQLQYISTNEEEEHWHHSESSERCGKVYLSPGVQRLFGMEYCVLFIDSKIILNESFNDIIFKRRSFSNLLVVNKKVWNIYYIYKSIYN